MSAADLLLPFKEIIDAKWGKLIREGRPLPDAAKAMTEAYQATLKTVSAALAAAGSRSETSSVASGGATRKGKRAFHFREPEDVDAWIKANWARLANPDERETVIHSRDNGRLCVQDMRNIYHWALGHDDALRSNEERTVPSGGNRALYEAICGLLNGYNTPEWVRSGERAPNPKPKRQRSAAAAAGAGRPPIAPVAVLADAAEPEMVSGEVRLIDGNLYLIVGDNAYSYNDATAEAGDYAGRLEGDTINTAVPEELDESC